MVAPLPNPFLGLQPFRQEDRRKLYGRDADLILAKDRIFSARTTLLFAGSGVGKTSFLNAKVIPDLKPQYTVVYHNQWAIDEPLISLGKSLDSQLPPTNGTTTETADQQSLLTRLSCLTKASTEEKGRGSIPRSLLILDQFEEIFQYHGYKPYFTKFIEELADVINSNNCNTRVLFSMREEFLGELSVFDNKIPDLFNNYYRLKCPTKEEAAEIIQLTCQYVQVQYREANVKELVTDLTKIRRGAPIDDVNRKPGEVVDLDIVAPPYLQIACRRLWDKTYPTRKDPQTGEETLAVQRTDFLDGYKSGDAWVMLKEFTQEKLMSLTAKERALVADAFGYLVTKQGAKIAYELSSLASHMQADEDALKSVLLKLSKSNILRYSKGPDGSRWFELYHDMYGSIIDEWKRSYRMEQKARLRRNLALAASLVVFIIGIAVLILAASFFVITPRQLKATLASAKLEDPDKFQENAQAYEQLVRFPWYRTTAGKLWADAWKRRAYEAERLENKTESFLSWLKAMSVAPDEDKANLMAEARNYLENDDFASLQATVRFDGAISATETNPPIFSVDGSYFLKTTPNEFRLMKWNSTSGDLIAISPPLQVEGQRTTASQAPRPNDNSPAYNSEQPSIRAATGNLVAGFDNNKFYIWTFDKGTIIWSQVRIKPSVPGGAQLNRPPATDVPYNPMPSSRPIVPTGQRIVTTGPGIVTTGQSYGSNSTAVSVALSPDGRHFGLIDDVGVVLIFAIDDKQKVSAVRSPISSASKIVFSPDNETFALLIRDQTVQLRSIASGEVSASIKPKQPVRDLSFSPDGKGLVVQAQGLNQAEIYELPSGRLERTTGDLQETFSLNFLSDSKRLFNSRLIGLPSGALYVHYLDDQSPGDRNITLENFNGYYCNPNGQSILTTNEGGIGRIWGLTQNKHDEGRVLSAPNYYTRGYASDNGRVVALMLRSGEIEFWDTDNLTLISKVPTLSHPNERPGAVNQYYFYTFLPVTLSDDGRLAYIRETTFTRGILWDIKAGREISLSPSGNTGINAAVFSPDNDSFVFSASDGNIHVWTHLTTPTPSEKILKQNRIDTVNALFPSPTGKLVAAICAPDVKAGTTELFVKVFDVAAGTELESDDLLKRPTSLRISDDGKIIVAFSDDRANTLIFFDLKTKTHQLLTHNAAVTSMDLSPEKNLIAVGCSDGTVQLWRTDGSQFGSAQRFGSNLRSVRFSGDSKAIIIFSDQWIHLALVTDDGLSYRTGYLTNANSTPLRIMNAHGTLLRRLYFDDYNQVGITDINIGGSNGAQLPDVETSPEKWMERLGVRLDGRGKFISSY